jgi:hypothetical protein
MATPDNPVSAPAGVAEKFQISKVVQAHLFVMRCKEMHLMSGQKWLCSDRP